MQSTSVKNGFITVDEDTVRLEEKGPRRRASCPAICEHPESEKIDTTIMVQNLPNRVSKTKVLAHLALCGVIVLPGMIALPLDKRTGSNRGYAFVKVLPSQAERFPRQPRWHRPHRTNPGMQDSC